MNVLVTGGAGYIGSHASLRLLEAGHRVSIVDDLSRGNRAVVDVLTPLGDLFFAPGNMGDRGLVAGILRDRAIDVVMHFGAWTYVGESVDEPLRYYRNNSANALALLEAMDEANVRRFIFSSTCATYGEPSPEHVPIPETCPQHPVNPYGRSKLFVEQILADYTRAATKAGRDFAFAALRYFNVAGCDAGGRLGEDHDPETHLIPICLQVALGQRDALTIFGDDYPTPDGTCIRDYVHVEDLVDAHIAVMQAIEPGEQRAYNVGIGRGYSVREVVDACRRVTGTELPTRDGARRAGDPPELYANPAKIQGELGWTPQHTELDEIIATAWRWMKTHPHGYGD